MHSLQRPGFRFWLTALFLTLLAIAGRIPGYALAQDTPSKHDLETTATEEARIATYFDATLGEIQEFIDARAETSAQVRKTLANLATTQLRLEQELRQIKGMARIVQGKPYETRGILQDLKSLRKEIRETRGPAENLFHELSARQNKIGLLAMETDQPWTRELPSSLQSKLADLKRALTQSEKEIKQHQVRLGKALEAIKALDDRAQETLVSIEKVLPGFWKRLLFSPRDNLLDRKSWQDAPSELKAWIAELPTLLRIQLPGSSGEWIDWVGKVLVYWILILTALFLGLRRTVIWQRMIKARSASHIHIPWIWGSLALALLSAFFTAGYRQTTLQLGLIYLTLFYAIMRAAWTGRMFEQAVGYMSPLRPVFLLFAGATILQLLDLPQVLASLVWLFVLGAAMALARRLQAPFFLERAIAGITPTICLILLVLALFGLLQLSLLLAQIGALTCLFLQVVIVVTSWLRISVERLPATLTMTIVKSLVVGFGSPLIWILGISAILGWLTMHMGSDFVFQRISTMNLSWGEYSLNFFRFAVIIVLFYLTHAFGNIWGQILDQKYFRWSRIDPGIIASLRTTGGYAIWIISGIIAVNIMGIRLTSLAVIAGGLSVGIGFGLQNLTNNFISGLILLFGRTIQAGDVIQIDQLWGSVLKINIRNTEIRTFDNSIIFVPNSELISGRLTNWTHRGDCRLRRDLQVGVAYGSDIELVKTTLLRVAKEHAHVLADPAPAVLFKAFGASSLDFVLRVWVDHIDFSLSTLSDLHEAVNHAFAQAGIEISFPQMDVHLRDTVPFHVTFREDTSSS
ncbi:mechanosensitive ion channel domain-containing protein [Desulfoplanes formicivorans]|nr:mechanosensitive ion channel domain-containing protein [Desulfoplanes formicivorans]